VCVWYMYMCECECVCVVCIHMCVNVHVCRCGSALYVTWSKFKSKNCVCIYKA